MMIPAHFVRSTGGPKEGGKKTSCKSHEILRENLVQYQKAVKTAKPKYFSDLTEKNHHNPRALFSIINAVINPSVDPFPTKTLAMYKQIF